MVQDERRSRLKRTAKRVVSSVFWTVLLLPLMPLAQVMGGRLPFADVRDNAACGLTVWAFILVGGLFLFILWLLVG